VNPGQHRRRLRSLEERAATAERRRNETAASDTFPVTLRQLHGLEPISEADLDRLEAWTLRHGWQEGPCRS